MNDLTYEKMLFEDDIDIPQFIAIHQTPAIAKYISISEDYFHYVTNTANVHFYKVYENNTLVGSTHIEIQGNILYMDILVFPKFQRKGLGAKIVKDIQSNILGLDYEIIKVSIDETNIASLKTFQKAGFIRTSKDNELINFAYAISSR